MTEVSTTVAVVLCLGLLVLGLLVYTAKGGRLKNLNVDLLRGLLRIRSESDTSTPATTTGTTTHDDALKVLHWIQDRVGSVDGNYVVTESTLQNAQIAAQLYTRVHGEVIATAFFEPPDYGPGDFAATVAAGSSFTRIAVQSTCDERLATEVARRLARFPCRGTLVVIPDTIPISKLGGIFCRFPDRSHLGFLALNNVGTKGANQGLVFTGVLARHLFDYYQSFRDVLPPVSVG